MSALSKSNQALRITVHAITAARIASLFPGAALASEPVEQALSVAAKVIEQSQNALLNIEKVSAMSIYRCGIPTVKNLEIGRVKKLESWLGDIPGVLEWNLNKGLNATSEMKVVNLNGYQSYAFCEVEAKQSASMDGESYHPAFYHPAPKEVDLGGRLPLKQLFF